MKNFIYFLFFIFFTNISIVIAAEKKETKVIELDQIVDEKLLQNIKNETQSDIVENEFNIEIDNDSMEKMLSVKAAIEIIEQKLSA